MPIYEEVSSLVNPVDYRSDLVAYCVISAADHSISCLVQQLGPLASPDYTTGSRQICGQVDHRIDTEALCYDFCFQTKKFPKIRPCHVSSSTQISWPMTALCGNVTKMLHSLSFLHCVELRWNKLIYNCNMLLGISVTRGGTLKVR